MARRSERAKLMSKSLILTSLVALVIAGCAGTSSGGGGIYAETDTTTSFGNDTTTFADSGAGKDSQGGDTGTVKDANTVQDSSTIQDTSTIKDTNPGPDSQGNDVPDSQASDAKADIPKTDVSKTDTGADIKDVVAVNTCGTGSDIASLLKCTEGTVDFTLTGVLVTYVEATGFFVYDTSSSRGMLIYAGTTWPYTAPKVNDEITVHITKYASYQGQQEVSASDGLLITGAGTASTTALDLATIAANTFAEDYESRLVVGKGIKIKQLNGPDGIATLPIAGDVTLRVEGATTLCTGATFELKSGVLTQFGGGYRVQIMNGAADLGPIDTTGCSGASTYDQSNWGFEEVNSADPPPDFYKVGAALSAVRTTSEFHAGAAGCKVTWTAQDNQDLFSGLQVPVTAGQKATVSVWIKDSDPAGRARLGLVFYKADGTTVASSQYSGSYSADGSAWVQLSYSFTAPADVASVRGMVRMYDVVATGATWGGTATVYLDDWSVTVQ